MPVWDTARICTPVPTLPWVGTRACQLCPEPRGWAGVGRLAVARTVAGKRRAKYTSQLSRAVLTTARFTLSVTRGLCVSSWFWAEGCRWSGPSPTSCRPCCMEGARLRRGRLSVSIDSPGPPPGQAELTSDLSSGHGRAQQLSREECLGGEWAGCFPPRRLRYQTGPSS